MVRRFDDHRTDHHDDGQGETAEDNRPVRRGVHPAGAVPTRHEIIVKVLARFLESLDPVDITALSSQSGRTFSACSPLRPGTTSNSTRWPSCSVR